MCFTLSALSCSLFCLLIRVGTVTSYEDSWEVCWDIEPINRDPVSCHNTVSPSAPAYTQLIKMVTSSQTSLLSSPSIFSLVHYNKHDYTLLSRLIRSSAIDWWEIKHYAELCQVPLVGADAAPHWHGYNACWRDSSGSQPPGPLSSVN